MLRTILICAVVLGSAAGCTTAQQRPEHQAVASSNPCPNETGSRLSQPAGHCSSYPGRSYSQDDLARTGEADVGQALQLLDPSITVHH